MWASVTLALRILFGGASTYTPRKSSIRLVYLIFLYGQLLVTTFHSAHYITFVMRRITEPQVSTIEEIRCMDYELFASDANRNLLNGYNMVR